jgi:L-fuconate dehydratase
MLRLAREAVADGFPQIKLKVGGSLADDVRRLSLARQEVGPDIRIAIDANQRWDVAEAIAWVRELQPFDLAWIEEPTSPTTWWATRPSARRSAPRRSRPGAHRQSGAVQAAAASSRPST